MTQDEQPQGEQPQEDLKDQFRNLGENLKNVLNSAWESQERKNLQKEIQDGLNEVGEIVEGLMVSFRDSEAGQKFMEGMDDLSEKYQSGEMQETVRENLMNALDKLNANLKKASDKFTPEDDDDQVI